LCCNGRIIDSVLHGCTFRFQIATLQQYLDTALAAPRVVGIYPELKHPTWHNSLPAMKAAGARIEDLAIQALHARSFKGRLDSKAWRAQPAFLQSFEVGALKYLSGKTSIPLMLLLGGWPGYATPDTGRSHEEMATDDSLAEISLYASAIGPWKATLYTVQSDNVTIVSTGLTHRAQKQGLQVRGCWHKAAFQYSR
jgi:glycerophosphoryl diester phosphodiesterase